MSPQLSLATLCMVLVLVAGGDPSPVSGPVLDEHWDDVHAYCLTQSGVEVGSGRVIQPKFKPHLSCQDLKNAGQLFSGVYIIYRCVLKSPVAIPVYCDMETDGGGWTVFQRRLDGSQDFLLGWNDYKHGFGSLDQEFWLGNDFLSLLTSDETQELRVELEDFEGEKRYAKYSKFEVQPEYNQYYMTVSGYQGDAGDSLTYHSGSKFTTKDRDNDANGANCAILFPGAWWFKSCVTVNLNGVYNSDGTPASPHHGVYWRAWKGSNYSLKSSEMKIRPAASD